MKRWEPKVNAPGTPWAKMGESSTGRYVLLADVEAVLEEIRGHVRRASMRSSESLDALLEISRILDRHRPLPEPAKEKA